jgi:hypothetical protein
VPAEALHVAYAAQVLSDEAVELTSRRAIAPALLLTEQYGDAVIRGSGGRSIGEASGSVPVRMTDAARVERITMMGEPEPQIEIL